MIKFSKYVMCTGIFISSFCFIISCKNNDCTDCKGRWQGPLQVGNYPEGTAWINIEKNCKASFYEELPGKDKVSQVGEIDKEGKKFIGKDGSTYGCGFDLM